MDRDGLCLEGLLVVRPESQFAAFDCRGTETRVANECRQMNYADDIKLNERRDFGPVGQRTRTHTIPLHSPVTVQ